MRPPNRTLSAIVLAIIALLIVAAVYAVLAHPAQVRPVHAPMAGSPATRLSSLAAARLS